MLREEAGSRRRWVSRVSVPAEELWKGELQAHREPGSGQPGLRFTGIAQGAAGTGVSRGEEPGLLQFQAVR